jgi:two-component system nitrate/nitrite response regulator NarL
MVPKMDEEVIAAAEAIRVLIVEDEDLICGALVALLQSDRGIRVVACRRSIDQLEEALSAETVDVVVVDSQLRGMHNGVDMIPAIRQAGFAGPAVILGSQMGDSEVLRALRQGATGIVLKTDAPADLSSAIRRVHEGGCWIADQYVKLLVGASTRSRKDLQKGLSDREIAILRGLLRGYTNKEIAADLGVTECAVKSNIQHLFAKTGTRNRSRLLVVAMERYGPVLM